MTSFLRWSISILLVTIGVVTVNTVANSCPYSKDDAKQLLGAIENVVAFYKRNYEKVAIGGIGLGVLKGQLNYVLDQREDKLSPDLKNIIESLEKSSGKIALDIFEQSLAATNNDFKKSGWEVFRDNKNIVQARYREWHNPSVISKHFGEFDRIGDEKGVIDEPLNFGCLVALVQNCTVSEVCKKRFLETPSTQRQLAGQILYQQFAIKRSCIAKPENREAFGNAQEFQDRLCAKAYLEAEKLEKQGFPTGSNYIFAEHVGFCGLLGYPNFLKSSWLRQILSWQSRQSGCVPNHYGEKRATDGVIQGEYGSEGESEDCLVHLTSVSLMALALNVRYLVDTCPPNIFDGYSSNPQ